MRGQGRAAISDTECLVHLVFQHWQLAALARSDDDVLSYKPMGLKIKPGRIGVLLLLQLAILAALSCGSGSPTLSSQFVMPVDRLPGALTNQGVRCLSVQGSGEISEPGFVNNAISVDESALRVFSETPAHSQISAHGQQFSERLEYQRTVR